MKGAAVINQRGQKMTVLGFNQKSVEKVKMLDLFLRSELTANKDS